MREEKTEVEVEEREYEFCKKMLKKEEENR